MKLEDILALSEIAKRVEQFTKPIVVRDIPALLKEYKGAHVILDKENKTIGSGTTAKTIITAKLILRYQKKIVNAAVRFLFGKPVNYVVNNEKDSFKVLFNESYRPVFKANKMQYFDRRLARKVLSETHAAELWYINPDTKEIKVILLAESLGYKLYPHYNELGDMDAFTRQYEVVETIDKKDIKVKVVEVYTDKDTFKYTLRGSAWAEDKVEKRVFEKIPIIYYMQEEVEWADVQTEIERMEKVISTFADTNDYFSSPMVKVKGTLENAPSKDEVGKMITIKGDYNEQTGKMEYGGDISYLTWDNAPEAVRMEYEILKDIIHSLTATPDLSFNNVKGVGTLAGITLRFMFMDSIMKAADKEEIFGEGLTRRINLLREMFTKVNVSNKAGLDELDLTPEFQPVIPQSDKELVDMLSQARGGEPIISSETAVELNTLVEDKEAENKRLKEESNQLSKLAGSFNL